MANTDDDNHDSNDSTSLPGHDIKYEKSQKNEKSNRLRAKPDIPVIFSDSEDSEFEGYYTRKRKNSSESEDDWNPQKGSKAASLKKKAKTEKSPKKGRKPKEPKAKKEAKVKKEKDVSKPRKPRGRKPKAAVKEENSNDAFDEKEPVADKETEEESQGDGENDNDTAEETSNSNPGESEAAPAVATSAPELSIPKPAWKPSELLSDLINVDLRIAENIIRLFENENTIPFIARYRREVTGDMSPETLRQAKDAFESIKSIQLKCASILKAIQKLGKLTPHLQRCILGARSHVELEHLYAPFKVGSKRTKAEAARQMGLEPSAMSLLEGSEYVALEPLIEPDTPGRQDIDQVEANVSFIIADVISKDKEVLDHLRTLLQNANNIRIESSLSRSVKSVKKETAKMKKVDKGKTLGQKGVEEGKYELYYNFSAPVRHVKPHQVLALNRGENQKVLSVKVVVPDWLANRLHQFCGNRWLNHGYLYPLRKHFFEKSFKDAFTRLIHPLIARQVRSTLNQEAERAAIEVFATNVKNLLLTPPLRGTTILSIDPGFNNGCKAALISAAGAILDTEVFYINNNRPMTFKPPHHDPVAARIKDLLTKHRCEMIGLGNGKGCRETEEYLSHLIQSEWFKPLDVQYTVVSEQGASIYSCSAAATAEFPHLDRNLISAVSLARRVQDPLSEMVKVEPRHLGVGMYQHDVSAKQLNATLDEVVSECVSFVGVDINTASLSLLRRVAGLNESRALKILEWRRSSGPFTNRQQLKQVKSVGDKTYEQCAGFIRIVPQSISGDHGGKQSELKKQSAKMETDLNPLDQTWIHPESYAVANRFMRKCLVNVKDLGTPDFILNVEKTVKEIGLASLSAELATAEPVVRLIAEALQKPCDHDLRCELARPLFRRGVTSLQDLNVGTTLTGRVQNVTHFGTFVDIGVGTNGLIPASRLRSASNPPQLGDRVEVRVLNLELQRKRIALDLIKLL